MTIDRSKDLMIIAAHYQEMLNFITSIAQVELPHDLETSELIELKKAYADTLGMDAEDVDDDDVISDIISDLDDDTLMTDANELWDTVKAARDLLTKMAAGIAAPAASAHQE